LGLRVTPLVDHSVNDTQKTPIPRCGNHCPHLKFRSTQSSVVPVCAVLPVANTISAARLGSHCTVDDYPECPHFRYAVQVSRRGRLRTKMVKIAPRRYLERVSDFLWVIGVPLTIMVVIVAALILTQ